MVESDYSNKTGSFTTSSGFCIINQTEYSWNWDVFGGGLLTVKLLKTQSVPVWRRILTRIFLGSKWVYIG